MSRGRFLAPEWRSLGDDVGQTTRALIWSLQLRQAKIQKLRPRPCQHDVARLQIPVDDPLPVRLVQRIRDLNSNLQCLIQRQRALLQPVGQRLALQVLHDQEVDPVLAADVVEGANVRVIEAGDGLGLALEPLLQIRGRRRRARAGLRWRRCGPGGCRGRCRLRPCHPHRVGLRSRRGRGWCLEQEPWVRGGAHGPRVLRLRIGPTRSTRRPPTHRRATGPRFAR